MTTQFITSENDFQIAYDVYGAGPALLLVHGFSNSRTMWRDDGWIDHFQSDYTVVTMDVRGCGESTATHEPTDYSQQSHLADVINVLDACSLDECIYWGWSFGATIGTHLATGTDRLKCAVIAGTYFGPLFSVERWRNDTRQIGEIAKAKREGRLGEIDIPERRRAFAESNDIALLWARRYAVESWPAVEAADLQCPALIYTGSEDGQIVETLQRQRSAIESAGLKFHIFDGLDHRQLVSERDVVASVVEPFVQKHI
ncbi:MAG: alpha/beta hydrolase [Chloroflexota bacterium]